MLTAFLVIVAALLIALIMLQERSSGLSSVLGGAESAPYHARRGLEKTVFRLTVVLAVAFGVLAVAALVL